jgi:hypothetical protein
VGGACRCVGLTELPFAQLLPAALLRPLCVPALPRPLQWALMPPTRCCLFLPPAHSQHPSPACSEAEELAFFSTFNQAVATLVETLGVRALQLHDYHGPWWGWVHGGGVVEV